VASSAGMGGAMAQVADEGAVYLESIDRQLLQIGERGVAGAEVVDGDRIAGPGQEF